MSKPKQVSHAVWIAVILLACGLVLWPLAKPGFFVSDDGEWMVIRLSAFFQSLREGEFPVRFLGRLNQSYGYPVANFLYPGFLYLGSAIHVLGFSFPDTVKLILAGSVVVGTLFTYLWLRQFFAGLASAVGALSLVFAPYLLFDLYQRGSVGELLALSAALAALYSLEARQPWLFTPAVGLLLISHNSLGLLFTLLIIAYLFVRHRREFIWPLFLGLGMAAFFWFPALYERRYVVFDDVNVSDPASYFIKLNQLWLLGPVGIVAFCLALADSKKEKLTPFFLAIFAFFIFMSTRLSYWLWGLKPLVQLLQFPYRFLLPAMVAGAWLTALVIQRYKSWRWYLFGLFLLVWVWPVKTTLGRVDFIQRSLGYYTTNEATTTVADEYMPRWVTQKPTKRANQRIEFYQGAGTIDVRQATTQAVDVTVDAQEESVVQINSIYYPGWGIAINDISVPIDYHNPQGIIRVTVPSGTHRLVAQFRETVPRFLADLVSVASLVIYVFYFLWVRRKSQVHHKG